MPSRYISSRGTHSPALSSLTSSTSSCSCILKAERQLTEDVTKEAGLLVAARFCLFVGDLSECRRLVKKLLRGAEPSTPAELDAATVELWCGLAEAEARSSGVGSAQGTIVILS